MFELIENSLTASTLNRLPYVVLVKVYEESLASQRYVVRKLRGILIVFSVNWIFFATTSKLDSL